MEKIIIPNEEIRLLTLKKLRETNHRLEGLGLEMDELLGMIESELRLQKRQRWQKKDTKFKIPPKN
jgi:hypothetical protein